MHFYKQLIIYQSIMIFKSAKFSSRFLRFPPKKGCFSTLFLPVPPFRQNADCKKRWHLSKRCPPYKGSKIWPLCKSCQIYKREL